MRVEFRISFAMQYDAGDTWDETGKISQVVRYAGNHMCAAIRREFCVAQILNAILEILFGIHKQSFAAQVAFPEPWRRQKGSARRALYLAPQAVFVKLEPSLQAAEAKQD